MRLLLTIAYDGGPYAGWQSQAAGDAVQDFVEEAFRRIAPRRVPVHGAGRTDSGVHALGQCAHADVPGGMSPGDWQRALNANLPPLIRVVGLREVPPEFHARFSAKGKVYRYLIRNRAVLPPHEFGRVWHLPQALDLGALRLAANVFIGHHDFTAFSVNRGKAVLDTARTVRQIALSSRSGLVKVTFEGDGFLYKMVRMLTAAMVRVARRREDLGALRQRLEQGAPKWNHVAPAGGLYLVKVLY
jgi:tRNA pseudouridine38-40 synthase